MNLTKLTTSILASVVIAAGLVTTSTLPAEAAAKNTVRANPAKPIVNERFTVTGKLSTPVKRKAYLQLKSAGKWKKVDTDTTTSKGAYKLSSRTKADRDYRIVAPATTIHGKSYKRINGPAKKVRVVEQTAKIKTSNATPSVGESITITGTFSSARKGRAVVVYVKINGKTIKFAQWSQDRKGRAVGYAIVEAGDEDTPAEFFMRAKASKGAAAVTTDKVTVTPHL